MRGADTQSRSTLRALQSHKLRRLLTDILPENAFYGRKLGAAGVDPEGVRGLEDLERLPFTTKEELQEDQERRPPYGTNLSFPLERYVRLHQTSGTSGQPVRWLDTAESWRAHLACWQVIFDAAGVEASDRFLFPFSFGPFIGFWAAFDGAVARGNLCIPGGGLSSVARLRWILEHGVTVVASTPTYALRLAEVAREEGIDLAAGPVRALIVAGEPGGCVPAVRSRIEALWGARCFDHWGMTEVGPLGFEPLERPGGIHLIETHCIAEVVDPSTGTPLSSPGRGELVITTLERAGMPLLRYRTGDLVETSGDAGAGDTSESCPKPSGSAPAGAADGALPPEAIDPRTGGVSLRLEGGVLGRVDQMVFVRGNNIYPAAVDAVVRQFDDVVEYQSEILASADGRTLRIRVELVDGVDPGGFPARFARAFQDRFFFRPLVEVVAAGSLPRFELKARRFVIREGAASESG